MAESPITDADIDRMKRGFELFNQGDFDALEQFVSPDVEMARVGDLPPIKGWEAFRQFQEPDAFEWQRVEPLTWEINGNKALLQVRIASKGAMSGLEVEMIGWLVWTVSGGLVVHMANFVDEVEARAAAGLGQNDSP